MTDGFPELTDSFLSGQDILYAQFNEIEFYVEDVEQEHFYFNILRNLFPDIKFEKIFPLNGKSNVINGARMNTRDKRKIYLVDLDFDHILGTIEDVANLFYLKKYSIENYLCTKSAIYELIRSKTPKLKDADIDALFDLDSLLANCIYCLKELACSFIVIQKHQLQHYYYVLNVNRDFVFDDPPVYRLNFVKDYLHEVEIRLKMKDRRFSLNSQINKFFKFFNVFTDALSNIPGKYILLFLKERLQSLKLINQMSMDTFTYSLSKDFESDELTYLRSCVVEYIKE
ncbi:DUF4435 domain-containing protein [Niabella beijingensis]|uniref:DUF4435 domain-containing protein n=1 Tax=Niabella beijingensis TaxID=2872700 RepID=UPI001CBB682C|nr:DUF4435 domain-containing protein [Niabella beijingensis]MBZ4187436.1 DUF4435 domain-containing protein [Niabella beijingensis]